MAEAVSLEGFALRCGPLGEQDRLLTVLSEHEGLVRLAVPGARKPKSSLAAAQPLTLLQLQVAGNRGLRRVRQLRVLRSYSGLGERLDTLSAAQALAEQTLLLTPSEAPVEGLLPRLLLAMGQLEAVRSEHQDSLEALAITVQACAQLLALGGYALPLQHCARSGEALEPPLGNWDWRCSLLPAEGFVLGAEPGARLVLNASELALLQRLLRPVLPRRRDGQLMGPPAVWLRLLDLVELWQREHLGRSCRSFRLLRDAAASLPGTSTADRESS